MTEWDILLWTVSHLEKYSIVYGRRVDDIILLYGIFTQYYNAYYTVKLQVGTELCLKYWSLERVLIVLMFLACSFLVWYAIKIVIRPRSVSIFSDLIASSFSSPMAGRYLQVRLYLFCWNICEYQIFVLFTFTREILITIQLSKWFSQILARVCKRNNEFCTMNTVHEFAMAAADKCFVR